MTRPLPRLSLAVLVLVGVGSAALAGCSPKSVPPSDAGSDSGSPDSGASDSGAADSGAPIPSWDDDPCAALDRSASAAWADVVATWFAEDAASPPARDDLVVVGSSSIRRWETAVRDLAPWGPIQRGFGGAWLRDVAAFAPELVVAHHPRGVLVYAGTNDIAEGRAPADVVTDYRCLVQQVWRGVGDVPVLFVGIVPTPARWKQWATSSEVNAGVAALSAEHPGLRYVDVPAAFLATGSPPAADLFVDDGLHLSPSGYALWTSVVRPAVEAALPDARPAPTNPSSPATGARVLVDLGPGDGVDGVPAPSPDGYGHHWNAWRAVPGSAQVLAGEAVGPLVDVAGADTGLRLVISGGFRGNGLRNGGLVDPDPARLGDLAVPEATEDFFYVDGPDDPGGIAIVGLDPARRYALRLFASRSDASEARVTRYTVYGGGAPVTATLATTGPGIGAGSSPDGNVDAVVAFAGLAPDPWGQLDVDVAIEAGAFAYLSVIELTVE